MLTQIRKDLRALENTSRAFVLGDFFKTDAGGYGEGDQFLGLTVPQTRSIAKRYRGTSLADSMKLLKSPWHEERLLALYFMVDLFKRGDEKTKAQVYNAYMKNTKYVNNWDLVDSSAHLITGPFLEKRPRKILYEFAKSKDLWKRRIAVVATFHFIRQKDFKDILALSKLLLKDDQDLMHKATGWMLREMGKRELAPLHQFLRRHAWEMPRTMLRYSIEKLPINERQFYMKQKALRDSKSL